ncbi:MAG: response regulator transcription factor [Nitrospirae bacterium]|nr:MAG: response regulator transcription factor [Nitrospirota bacterium]
MLRVLIADDHPIVLKGLTQLLQETGLVNKITAVHSGEEAVALIAGNNYDLVILDISMPGMDGIETTEEIRKLNPSLPVLIISMYPEKDYAIRAFKAGALGYLTKKSASGELAVAIKKVMRRERYITPTLADLLAESVTDSNDKPLHERLSNREMQVMGLIVEGRSLKEIGGAMSLSPKTIGTFRTRILQKLNMTSNAELVKYAMKHNLFELPSE